MPRRIVIAGAFLALSGTRLAAQAAPEFVNNLFQAKVEQLKQARAAIQSAPDDQKDARSTSFKGLATDLAPFLLGPGVRYALSELEMKRFDKQLGAPTNSPGSTSFVSKGSVPSLFALAVENGALTRNVSGTAITFRGSPANILSALATQSFLAAGPAVPPLDGSLMPYLKRGSFYVTYDTARGRPADDATSLFTASRQQLAAWGARADLINKRDPRRPEYVAAWRSLMATQGQTFIDAVAQLEFRLIGLSGFTAWKAKLGEDALAASDDRLPEVFRAAYDGFDTLMADLAATDPVLARQLRHAQTAAREFALARSSLIDGLMKSLTVAVEYNFTAQANTGGFTTTVTGAQAPLPDLGNMNLVLSKGFLDGPELTFNAGWTWFQNRGDLNVGRTRDVRMSVELEVPLRELPNIGLPTLAASGQFLRLVEEPLGQKVTLLGKELKLTGNIWLGQIKVTLPAKGAGVRIPLSFTYSNRTELVPNHQDWRVNLGLLFDMDKLFAKP